MSSALRERLTALLVKGNILTQEKLDEALKIQKQRKERIGELLVKLGYISPDNLIEVLSAELGIPAIHIHRYKPSAKALSLIPRKMAELYNLVPVSVFGNTLTIAMADPMNIEALDDVRRLTQMETRTLIAQDKEIREAIEQYYGENLSSSLNDVVKGMEEENLEVQDSGVGPSQKSAQELLRLTEEEPVVKLTNSILAEAVRRRSSDIFIEPEEKTLRVRLRVDGLLQEGLLTTRAMHPGVVSRLKVMSNLDIAEHRVPQDGRFKIRTRDREVDFRVSVLPTYFGEKVVLRVLDKNQAMLDIEKLGFEPEPLAQLKKAASHPHGMIVICGPTGSGKTTTLYSVLKLIDTPDKNLVTVEDPVEVQIDGINQVAIRSEVELTFAAALRSILRQDPDVIMVGEIRDSETADVAIKAALTGHLVLSTLHATTAVGAVTRFVNMGIEPFLITSSVLLAGSQRLVRKICLKCRESYEPSKELMRELAVTEKHLGAHKRALFYRGKGCEACGKSGYAGRAVLLEALTLSPAVKDLILKCAQEHEIKKRGLEEGMKTLRENGIAKILQGVTTPEEVLRVTVCDEDLKT
ncbi:MAG: Flp pilus assembly complex ATPase component TadA [Candidatus Omnitrophica bacterium]|nr:Flp pilus assembly complex ATPase component TadA [Candidatus Omnitrophota bacterium]